MEEVNVATEAVHEQLAPDAQLFHLISPQQSVVQEYLKASSVQLCFGPESLRHLPQTVRRLRRQRFDLVLLPTSDQSRPWSHWIAGLLGGWPSVALLDAFGNAHPATVRFILADLAKGAQQRLERSLHLAGSALRLARERGLRAALERARLRTRRLRRWAFRARLVNLTLYRPRIRLQSSPEPDVSIVIPVHNRWGFTYHCLRSIAEQPDEVSHEVILVDNGSTDDTVKAGVKVNGLKILRFEENLGFVEGCNRGAIAASGRYVLFLNNDVLVTQGWLHALLGVLEKKPRCGAVGAKLLFPDGSLQEAGGIVWRTGAAWNYGRFDDPEGPEYSYLREVDYCSGAALLVRRGLFQRIGGFDQRYSPGYWEDTDLCFSLREAGSSVWFQPASVVVHFEGGTSGIDEGRGMKRFQEPHGQLFREKWEAVLEEHWPFDPGNLFVARDRNRGPIVLVFDHYVPTYDRDAGSGLMYHLLLTLVEVGCRVLFWPDNLFRTPLYTERLQQKGVEVLYGSLDLRKYLHEHGKFIDFAIAHRAKIAARYLPEVRDSVSGTAYIAADLEHVREERRLEVEGGDRSILDSLREREEGILALADCVAIHSPEEKRVLESELGARSVLWLPLPVPDRPPTPRPFEGRQNLLFVGSTHPPNVDAIRHFATEILPAVRRRLPGIEIWVVGEVGERVSRLRHLPGVRLVGYVEDLTDWFDRARLFVAPIRFGGGIKGKILDALNHGLPVITNPMGAEGIGLRHGKTAMIADSDEAFVEAIVEVYTRPDRWLRLREGGREHLTEELSMERFRSAVQELVDSLGARSR